MAEKYLERPVFQEILKRLPSSRGSRAGVTYPFTFGYYPHRLSARFRVTALPDQRGYVVRHPSSEGVLALAQQHLAAQNPKQGRPLTEREIQEVRYQRYTSGHTCPTLALAEDYDTSENFIMMCSADKQFENLNRIVRDRRLERGWSFKPVTHVKVPLHDVQDELSGEVLEQVTTPPPPPPQLTPVVSPPQQLKPWRQEQTQQLVRPQRWENHSNRNRYQYHHRPAQRPQLSAYSYSNEEWKGLQQPQLNRSAVDEFRQQVDFFGVYSDPNYTRLDNSSSSNLPAAPPQKQQKQ